MDNFQGISSKLTELVSELEHEIARNNIPDADGYCAALPPETLARVAAFKNACGPFEDMLRACEKLYGGDHSDTSFNPIFDEALLRLREAVKM